MYPKYLFSKGFTLVELMVVIAVIGILAASLFPSMTQYFSRARDTTRFSDLNKVAKALDMYYVDKGIYPNNINESATPATPLTTGDCLTSSWWNCWGNPEPSSPLNAAFRPTRLVPKEYLDTMPIDPKNFDNTDACSVSSNQMSYLYSYASEDIGKGYVLTTRLENTPGVDKIGTYTGTRIGCTGYANYGIVQGNGGMDLALGIVGK